MTCSTCSKWFVRKETHYGNGEIIVNWTPPEGCGTCQILNNPTPPTFECNQYSAGTPIVETAFKEGEPWHHWVFGVCPTCKGEGAAAGVGRYGMVDDQCCGTGRVRYYDDGYIGENKTCRHPNEKEKRHDAPDPTCFNCHKPIGNDWMACPYCGTRLKDVVKPEPEQVL